MVMTVLMVSGVGLGWWRMERRWEYSQSVRDLLQSGSSLSKPSRHDHQAPPAFASPLLPLRRQVSVKIPSVESGG